MELFRGNLKKFSFSKNILSWMDVSCSIFWAWSYWIFFSSSWWRCLSIWLFVTVLPHGPSQTSVLSDHNIQQDAFLFCHMGSSVTLLIKLNTEVDVQLRVNIPLSSSNLVLKIFLEMKSNQIRVIATVVFTWYLMNMSSSPVKVRYLSSYNTIVHIFSILHHTTSDPYCLHFFP